MSIVGVNNNNPVSVSASLANNKMRTDVLTPIGDGAQPQLALQSTVADGQSAYFITDYLNGTVSCMSTSFPNPTPAAFPPAKFIGTGSVRGRDTYKWTVSPPGQQPFQYEDYQHSRLPAKVTVSFDFRVDIFTPETFFVGSTHNC